MILFIKEMLVYCLEVSLLIVPRKKDRFCRKDNPRLSENYNPIICVEPKGKEDFSQICNSISESVREVPPGEYQAKEKETICLI